MENQQKLWDTIAEEWHKFKKNPSAVATEFINKSQGKILDFGSGSGRNLLKIKKSKKREFYLVDFSKEMLERAEERTEKLGINITTKVSRLEKIDLPSNYFDGAICVAAIHCVETSKKRKNALKELYRILKPGAKADIEVWNKNSGRFKNKSKETFIAWTDKGHRYYYLYDEKEFEKLLKNIGFKIIKKIPHRANLIFIVEK